MVSHNPKISKTKQRIHESWSIVVDSRLVIKIGLLGSFMRNPNRFFEGFCLILCLVADLSFFSCPVIIYFWCFGLLWLNNWLLVRQPEKGFSKKNLIVFTLGAKVSFALYLIMVVVEHFSGFSNLGFFL